MKAKKVLKTALITIGSLVFLFLLVFLFWLGPTVKLIAQNIGSKALGTPLTIDTLSINPRKGTIQLSDFAIANPDLFGHSNAVSLTSLDIAIDVRSLFSETILVHRVEINSPHFVYEQGSASDNINEFILSIYEFIGFDPDAPLPPPDPKKIAKEKRKQEKKKAKEPKVVLIESLAINDVQIHLANTDDPQLDMKVGFEQLSLSMTNGAVRLDDFYVGNPGRLETSNLFTLDDVAIDLEPSSCLLYTSDAADDPTLV